MSTTEVRDRRERRRRLRIEDSVASPPFALVDDVVVVVRTPRSSDFVTVEVGHVRDCSFRCPCSERGLRPASGPAPWFASGWCGEVHVGEEARFEVAGRTYRLTLEGRGRAGYHPPWASYEFLFERGGDSPASPGAAC
jgi:hypothetical protein